MRNSFSSIQSVSSLVVDDSYHVVHKEQSEEGKEVEREDSLVRAIPILCDQEPRTGHRSSVSEVELALCCSLSLTRFIQNEVGVSFLSALKSEYCLSGQSIQSRSFRAFAD